ncbi:MAG: methionine biosynthesis protein MetW [Hyphomonadaceae bacterium]
MTQLELVHPAPLDLRTMAAPRPDHLVIAQMVDENASVLDVGCDDGALIALLAKECRAKARGMERDSAKVAGCVSRGLSVVQGEAERDLAEFPSGAFNTVIFSHSLLNMQNPREVLRQAGRVGERVIISIANAAHWRTRMRLISKGRTAWPESAEHQLCSVRDLAATAREMRFSIDRAVPISGGHAGAPFAKTLWRANWFAEEAVFLLIP